MSQLHQRIREQGEVASFVERNQLAILAELEKVFDNLEDKGVADMNQQSQQARVNIVEHIPLPQSDSFELAP